MLNPVLNNTKWRELQNAMYALKDLHPKWRTRCKDNGYETNWDGEWYYHFSVGGYSDIEWVEIQITSEKQRIAVLKCLQEIHLPGIITQNGFKVFGYLEQGQAIEYL